MTSRKRIRSLNPSVGGGGGGGPAPGGTIEWLPGDDAEPMTAASAVAMPSLGLVGALSSGAAVDMPSLGLTGALSAGAAVAVPALALTGAQSTGGAVAGSYSIENMTTTADWYHDQANGSTNFGGASTLSCKRSVPLSSNERIGYIEWNLTNFTGTPTSGTISLRASSDAPLGENVTIEVYTKNAGATNEFTTTWNSSEPVTGTLRHTVVLSLNSTQVVKTFGLNAAALSNMLGGLLFLKIRGTDTLGVNVITVASKEGGYVPRLTFEATL